MGRYIQFTDEDLYRANSVDLVLFLQYRGEKIERTGNTYKLVYTDANGTHDSITVNKNRWYDHKNNVGGRPIKFMQTFYGLSFQDAVMELLGNNLVFSTVNTAKSEQSTKEKKPFVLPDANSDMRRVYAYLTKARFISRDIISHFVNEKTLYEEKDRHNIVFVGVDESGIPRQAHKRSSLSYGKGSTFRMTVEGSDTAYSFAHFGDSNKLYVFEAPIDMLSYLTLYPQNWEHHSYIAMNGVYESAVLNALEKHKNLTEVYLCTDNDIGGIEAADRLRDILKEQKRCAIYRLMPQNKDFNEDLKAQNGITPMPAVKHRRKEMYIEAVGCLEYSEVNPGRTIDMLSVAIKHKNYTVAALVSLRTAAVLLSYEHGQSAENMFDTLKNVLISRYKSYSDKGTMNQRNERLSRKAHEVYGCLKQYPASTGQNRITAKLLTELSMEALSCDIECCLCDISELSDKQQMIEKQAM